jgi:hypothetical protein
LWRDIKHRSAMAVARVPFCDQRSPFVSIYLMFVCRSPFFYTNKRGSIHFQWTLCNLLSSPPHISISINHINTINACSCVCIF